MSMYENRIKGKTPEELLAESSTPTPDSVVVAAQRTAISVRCTQELAAKLGDLRSSVNSVGQSMDKLEGTVAAFTKSSDALSTRLVALNKVLTGATVFVALATVAYALLVAFSIFRGR